MVKVNGSNNMVSVVIASAIIFTGAFLLSTSVQADDSVVTTTTITVPVTCTMTGAGMNSHTAEIPNGIDSRGNDYYPDGIGATNLKAFCNDNEGFSIYAVGYSDNTIGSTYLRDSTLGQSSDIQTGTASSGNTSAWAMKLGVTTGTYTPTIAGSSSDSEKQAGDTDYSTWAEVPSSYTRVAYRNSATDIDNGNILAEGAQLTTTYATYISPTQKAGSYVGQVKYTLVHPASEVPAQPQTATSGCINYFANASTAVGTMGCQSVSASATSATLLASNFSRDGYGFAGWSDAYDYATNPNAHFYGPQEYITFTAGQYTGNNNGLALYAVWVKSEGSIQDTTKVASICNSLTTAPTDGTANLSSVSALTDQRDNETYAIAKLADGNCWMIENLRLESTNSDNSTGALAQGYGTSATYGNFSGLATPETPDKFSSTYSANSLYSDDGSNGTINIGTGSLPAYRMPRYNNFNTPTSASDRPQNPTDNGSTNSTSNAGMYSYGNYYTWHVAIADLTPNDTNNNSTTNTSLCPTGWRLPQGGDKTRIESDDDNDFWNLTVDALNGGTLPANYNSDIAPNYSDRAESGPVANRLRSYPNNFVYSGYVYNGSVYTRGSSGHYWSSTASSSNYFAYDLYLSSMYVHPGTGHNDKYGGRSIRCLVSGA